MIKLSISEAYNYWEHSDSLGDVLRIRPATGSFIVEVEDVDHEGVTTRMVIDHQYIGDLVLYLINEMNKYQRDARLAYLDRAMTAEDKLKTLQEGMESA